MYKYVAIIIIIRIIGERERANLVVQLARFFYVRMRGNYVKRLRDINIICTLCPLLNKLEERPWRQPRAAPGGASTL